jgi:translocation and assembly module TamB
MRLVRNLAIAFAGLIVVLAIAAILVVRSAWFQSYLKRTIITFVEESTGGRAEIGAFHFDWAHLSAVATDFVIHGTEPPGVPPLLRASRVQLDLRLLTSLHHWYDITYLGADQPQANVIVYPDGGTNLPAPRQKSTSDPLETVVDLAIGRFELNNGLITYAAQKQELNARASNVRAQLSYNTWNRQYRGDLSLQPVYVVSGRNTPVNFTLKLPVVIARNRIDVNNAQIFSPDSTLALSASFRDLKAPNFTAHATGHIALADLKNLANVRLSAKARNLPSVIDLDVNASSAGSKVQIAGLRLALGRSSLDASGSLTEGLQFNTRLALRELGRLIDQSGLDQASLPDEIATLSGTATLDPQGAYSLRGNLDRFDLRALSYEGILSAPLELTGNLNTGLRGLTARARIAIAPGSHGIPLSGNLNAEYFGARDDVAIQKSSIRLPHSRVAIDGSVGKRLNIALTTTNLDDLFAALPKASRPNISLAGGEASFTGQVTGRVASADVSGHLTATRLSVEGRRFDSLNADAALTKRSVTVSNGSLARNTMQARFSGTLALRDWKPLPNSPVSINATIQNGDLADLPALAAQPNSEYSGQLAANASIGGTFGNPQGAASLVITNGMVKGQPFDRAEAQVNLTDELITVPSAFVQLGPARANLTAEFRHPRDSFTTGQLRASLQSDPINLAQVSSVQKQQPNTAGLVQINATVAGNLANGFELTSIDGNASLRGLQFHGQNYGDLTANANTSGQSVNYNLTSNFAGSSINATGAIQLTRDYPTTARANLSNLPIQRLLAVADRPDLPVKGMLSGTANFAGTLANPQGSADLTLANATIYDDTVNSIHTRVNLQPQSIDVEQLELASGPDRVNLSARYEHPAGSFESGNLQFHLETNNIDLARIKTLAERRPGLGGTVQLNTSLKAEVRSREPRVQFREVDGSLKTSGLMMSGKSLGNLSLAASTSGERTTFTLSSTIAGASIEGRGSVQLASGYPADAQATFKNASWAGVRPLLGVDAEEGRGFDASADGELSLTGPLTNAQQLRGSVQVTRLQVSGNVSSAFHPTNMVLLQNQGPLAATFDRGVIKVQNAHLTGPQTDLQVTGTLPVNGDAMSVGVKGSVNLAVLPQFDRDISSSGNLVLAAEVRGSATKPQLTGQVELRNAAFHYVDLPVGLSQGNGVIALSGNSAAIRNLTAQAGGGQVTVTGSATLSDMLRFNLQANASRVRVMVQPDVGVVASGKVELAGSTASSAVSGTVTVDQISYNSRSDLGSLLSLASLPVQTPTTPSPLLENMRLDIRVRSASSLGVQSSMAQNLELTSDLRLRGTAAHPGVLGRVLITEGKLLFFGSNYTVNNGTISFYNPLRIEPVLDLSLETTAQGVDVVLKITGPVDNMKLSYTSDPPLQFQQIINLLAAGTTPTTDPTLLANQPALPAQSFEQVGESAIVGQAVANPVANQLSRVFGVTQLKINPTFATGSQLPETQLSLTQQISNSLTFTYVTGLNTANAETIQVLWTFTPQWSAQALRDYNGIFSVTLIYKKQFR